ncbi:hypothetical protein L9F63_011800, partial [Diploptera punctata]
IFFPFDELTPTYKAAVSFPRQGPLLVVILMKICCVLTEQCRFHGRRFSLNS